MELKYIINLLNRVFDEVSSLVLLVTAAQYLLKRIINGEQQVSNKMTQFKV